MYASLKLTYPVSPEHSPSEKESSLPTTIQELC